MKSTENSHDWFKAKLEETGRSQKSIAHELGYSKDYLNRILNNKNNLTDSAKQKIIALLENSTHKPIEAKYLSSVGFVGGEMETANHYIHIFLQDIWRLSITGKKGITGDESYIEDFFTQSRFCEVIKALTGVKLVNN